MSLVKNFNIIKHQAFAELRAESTRTFAGYLWWIMQPLLSLLVYYIAFNWIFARGKENYAVFMFSGIVFYQWFASTVARSTTSLIDNYWMMQHLDVHKIVFPLYIVLVDFIKFIVVLIILLVTILLCGYSISIVWFSLVPLLFLQLLFIIGVSCGVAAITPFIPDLEQVIGVILHLMFFLSGVFFNLSQMPGELQAIMRLNPMAVLIEQYRLVLFHNNYPQWGKLGLTLLMSLGILFVSISILCRKNKMYPKIG
jgi:homopolymeric O-antigen transport system permease protein